MMGRHIMKITVLDPIHCKVTKEDALLIAPIVSVQSVFWKQGPFRKEKLTRTKALIKRDGTFLTGWLPRIEAGLTAQNIPYSIS